MDRDDIRDWDSDEPSQNFESDAEVVYGRPNEEGGDITIDLPTFAEQKAIYEKIYAKDPNQAERLTAANCYYLGKLDGPEGSDLSVANKKRHLTNLEQQLKTADNPSASIDDLLRIHISRMHFEDVDHVRSRETKRFADTISITPASTTTPKERFLRENEPYIKHVLAEVCPGDFYEVPEERKVIPKSEMRSAIEAILWKLIPQAERFSYQSVDISE